MCDQSIAGAEKLDRSYVFILTYGRSGSTLLMSIINSSPECIVRGENGGALYALFESYRRIKEGQIGREMTSQRATSPWWGIAEVSLDEYARDLGQTLTRHIIRPSSEHRILRVQGDPIFTKRCSGSQGLPRFPANGVSFCQNHFQSSTS